MQMLLLSFAGSALAYFAFMAAASSAASAQSAAASNWPPTAAQQQALQVQISQLVLEVTHTALTAQEQSDLQALLANAPAQYQAGLPAGTSPTIAGYSAWVLAGSAAQAAASTANLPESYIGTTAGYVGAGPLAVPPNRRHARAGGIFPIHQALPEWFPPDLYTYAPPDNATFSRIVWDANNDPWEQIWTGRF